MIAVLEAYWPKDWPKTVAKYKGRLHTIYHGQPRGMRGSINEAVAVAEGDFIMKVDAHVMMAEGFDVELLRHCDDKTIVVPRRYRLDAENWKVIEDGRPPIDYEYLTPPENEFDGLKGKLWDERRKEREHLLQDETMLTQGSCWFMRKSYFHFLDLMDEDNYGTFWKEMLEISFKSYLSGGRILTDKATWYAHLHKPKRGYSMETEEQRKAHAFCLKWLSDESGWKKQTLPFTSLLERFKPPLWDNWKGTHEIHEVQQGSVSLATV